MDVLIILQLYANDFRKRTKGGNSNITRNASRTDALTLLTLLGADATSAVPVRVPSLSLSS